MAHRERRREESRRRYGALPIARGVISQYFTVFGRFFRSMYRCARAPQVSGVLVRLVALLPPHGGRRFPEGVPLLSEGEPPGGQQAEGKDLVLGGEGTRPELGTSLPKGQH